MSSSRVEAESDPEFQAITAILGALKPLDDEARDRVLDYALKRLGLRSIAWAADLSAVTPSESAVTPGERPAIEVIHDIRTLADEKNPKSAIEMATLVGYYLAHLAPEADRRADVTAADITKYFHDANFPLPESPKMTLVHAKNAGYFDAGASKGAYRLNPVGHNLVAHRLPAAATSKGRSRPRRSVKRPKPKAGSRSRKSG